MRECETTIDMCKSSVTARRWRCTERWHPNMCTAYAATGPVMHVSALPSSPVLSFRAYMAMGERQSYRSTLYQSQGVSVRRGRMPWHQRKFVPYTDRGTFVCIRRHVRHVSSPRI